MSHHDSDEENLPLLPPNETTGHYADQSGRQEDTERRIVDVNGQDFETGYQNDLTQGIGPSNEQSSRSQPNLTAGQTESFTQPRGGPTVSCRVCEAEISLEGRTNQHVVRCQQCNEATPIRAAPPGKKYVRCPCNCLLVCKASSNRIACPRTNCRRVITLGGSAPMGTAIRAPAGTCRVQCVHCQEIFMFNTLVNTVANCPHCKKSSSVGARYARTRAAMFLIGAVLLTIISIGITVGTLSSAPNAKIWYFVWVILYIACSFLIYRFVHYARLKVSQVLGPI